MPSSSRRRFLERTAALVSVAAVAGCNWAREPEQPTPAPEPTPTPADGPDGEPTETPADPAPLDGSWASYRRDAGNTAAVDDPGPATEPRTAWQRGLVTGPAAARPAAADGALFVVTDSGTLYARDAADGSVRWSGGGPVNPAVSPAVADGSVLAADGEAVLALAPGTGEERWRRTLGGPVTGLAGGGGQVVATTENSVVAIDAGDGTERWRQPVGESVVTPPGLGGETVAVGLASEETLALDTADGTVRLQQSVPARPSFAPAVAGERVYVAAGFYLTAFDPEAGERVWEERADNPIASPPATMAGAVYTVTLDENPTVDPEGTPRATDVEPLRADVVALSATDGAELWRAEEDATYNFTSGPPETVPLTARDSRVLAVVSGQIVAYDAGSGDRLWTARGGAVAPAVADGVVATGTRGLSVADGSVRWEFRGGDRVASPPAVVGNAVYAGSDDSYLYALSANAGAVEWTARADDSIRASPAVGDDAVYAGTMNGTLYAFDRTDGSELWQFDVGGQVQSPALADGTVYVGNFSPTLTAVDADGSERWRTTVDSQRFVALEVAVGDGAVYAGANGDLRAFEAADGSERWRVRYGERSRVQSPPVAADGRVYVNIGDSVRAFDAAEGAEQWSVTTGGSNQPPAIRDGTVYAPGRDDGGAVYALDAADGSERWQSVVGDDLQLAVGDGAVYGVGYDTPLVALDSSDGSRLWRRREFDLSTAPAIADEFLFFGTGEGRIRALGPRE
jgi:outer membrane protein assembly factor BamB